MHHDDARRLLDDALGGRETVAFTWVALLAFVRLVTHPAVFPWPLGLEDALDAVRVWLACQAATVIEPTGRHLALLAQFLASVGTAGNLVNDAHLARRLRSSTVARSSRTTATSDDSPECAGPH